MKLPHTYVDEADNTLAITDLPGPRLVTRTTIPTEDDRDVTEHAASVTAPKGAEAVALARAVLAAAGDTGHVVISERERLSWEQFAVENAARSMRTRAAETAYHDLSTENAEMANTIRNLPLLPDGVAALRNAAAITALALLTADAPAPTLCADPCPRGHDHTCARSPKHYGPHRDVKQKGTETCSWAGDHPL